MSKYFLSALLAVTLSISSFAQKHSFEFGFTGGLTSNAASGNGVANMAEKRFTGFSIGAQAKLKTSTSFGVKVILEYAQQGWQIQNLVFPDSSNAIVTFKMNYIQLPVMAEYSFGHKLKCNIYGGIFIGLLLNNQVVENYKSTVAPYATSINKYSSDYRAPLNYGLAGGIGFELPVYSRTTLHLNFRDMGGMANVYKQTGFPGTKIFLNSLSVTAGLNWRL